MNATILENTSLDGILTLTLNRSDKLNALNSELLQLLDKILIKTKTNPEIKGLIITGTGKAFCAGADIQELSATNSITGYEFARIGQRIFQQLESLGKPSLALVNGIALGGGCELLQACTLRMAAKEARFGQPEVKLGVIPGYGGTQRLSRLIGKGRALDLCLTGRIIDATTALEWGLVSEVVPQEHLIAQGQELMKRLLALAPLALEAVISVVHYGYDMPLVEALEMEALQFAKLCTSNDKQEGIQAFLEKRQAKFTGK